MNDEDLSPTNAMAALAIRMPEVGTAQVAIAVTRAHINAAVGAFGRIEETAAKARSNRTLNEAAQKVAAGKAVQRLTDAHERNLASAQEQLADEMQTVSNRLKAIERPAPEDTWLTPILAQHVLSLKSGERMALLAEAQKAGDTTSQRALLALPPYLSGIPPAVHEHGRKALHKQLVPHDAEHLEKLQQAAEVTMVARSLLDTAVKRHYTQEVASLIEMAKTAEAA